MSARKSWIVTGALGAVAVIGGSVASATADDSATAAGTGIDIVAAATDAPTPPETAGPEADARATDPASPTAGSAVTAQTAVSAQTAQTPLTPPSPVTPPSPTSAQSPASAPSPASADSAD
ncbi:hypothetical protein M3148_07585 [Georgenia satyanarayanai]|uniref:hypothetical protein n=1 Tax=Georgenia satyanarayanai TaxID=860221 RepID=UPI00204001EA|nr:hypothetical protein [Georgenia satyanarayanai]MCM3660857.1 hypothetical protein [Georgenia satyanarayanai]